MSLIMPAMAQNNDSTRVSQVLESRIHKRVHTPRSFELTEHKGQLLGIPANAQKVSQYKQFLSLQEVAKRIAPRKLGQDKQKLDSLVTYNGDKTDPVAKQAFVYNAAGLPSVCYNYVPDHITGKKWIDAVQYRYTFDSKNRLIEAVSLTDSANGFKYQYIYTSDNQPYTTKLYSTLADGQWTLTEKAEYAYDDYGNTVLEAYYSSSDNGATWIGSRKVTATYNEDGKFTSDYTYTWDNDSADWVGDNTSYGHKYYYRSDGQDDWIETFYWENGKWSNYYREYYTYDDKGQNVKYERTFWNREHQDWLGGDTWGDNSWVKNNALSEYVYDDKGRNTLEWAYSRTRDTEYKPNFKRTRDYTEMDNGRLKNEEKVYYKITSDEFELYNHRTIVTNTYGAECYYLNRQYVGKGLPLRSTDEIVRDIDDTNNCYYGAVFYLFTNDSANTRYRQTKETNYFDENGNRYMTIHQRATLKDSTWVDYDKYILSWENDGTGLFNLVGAHLYSYVGGEFRYAQGYQFTIDYTVPVANLILWPISNINELYYKYKTDECVGKVNNNINMPDDSGVQQTIYSYYYSPVTQTDGISHTASQPTEKKEVARYDVAGREVAPNSKGLLIVKYSDGSVQKMIMK